MTNRTDELIKQGLYALLLGSITKAYNVNQHANSSDHFMVYLLSSNFSALS